MNNVKIIGYTHLENGYKWDYGVIISLNKHEFESIFGDPKQGNYPRLSEQYNLKPMLDKINDAHKKARAATELANAIEKLTAKAVEQ